MREAIVFKDKYLTPLTPYQAKMSKTNSTPSAHRTPPQLDDLAKIINARRMATGESAPLTPKGKVSRVAKSALTATAPTPKATPAPFPIKPLSAFDLALLALKPTDRGYILANPTESKGADTDEIATTKVSRATKSALRATTPTPHANPTPSPVKGMSAFDKVMSTSKPTDPDYILAKFAELHSIDTDDSFSSTITSPSSMDSDSDDDEGEYLSSL